ncbi:MAG: chemotaxis protein CheX [Planctomycetaceae bacterium]
MTTATTTLSREQELAKPFLHAANAFFTMMLDSKCEIKAVIPVGDHTLEPITASVGISGSYNGIICISVTEASAKNVLNRLTGLEPEELDDFVMDAVGEMANMIGGHGKRELSSEELQLGLPKILVNENNLLFEPGWQSMQHVLLETDIGSCTLSILFDYPKD